MREWSVLRPILLTLFAMPRPEGHRPRKALVMIKNLVHGLMGKRIRLACTAFVEWSYNNSIQIDAAHGTLKDMLRAWVPQREHDASFASAPLGQ